MPDTTTDTEPCPVCDGRVNHVVRNGYRNTWDTDIQFWVCTTDESDWMYVHTEER